MQDTTEGPLFFCNDRNHGILIIPGRPDGFPGNGHAIIIDGIRNQDYKFVKTRQNIQGSRAEKELISKFLDIFSPDGFSPLRGCCICCSSGDSCDIPFSLCHNGPGPIQADAFCPAVLRDSHDWCDREIKCTAPGACCALFSRNYFSCLCHGVYSEERKCPRSI